MLIKQIIILFCTFGRDLPEFSKLIMYPKPTISEVHGIPRSTVWLKQKYIFPLGKMLLTYANFFHSLLRVLLGCMFIIYYYFLSLLLLLLLLLLTYCKLLIAWWKVRSTSEDLQTKVVHVHVCKYIFITEHRIWIAREKLITIESEHPFDAKILEEEMTGGNKFKARSVIILEWKM